MKDFETKTNKQNLLVLENSKHNNNDAICVIRVTEYKLSLESE